MLDGRFELIVLLGGLCSLPGIQAATRYIYVVAPRYIIPGSDYVTTVDMFNLVEALSGTYDVSVSLRSSYNSKINIVNETKTLSKGNSRGIFVLKIPVGATSRYVHVDVYSGRTSFGRTIMYTYIRTPPRDVILVQTDKGVYKAGQTVQFRVMSVNRKREVEVRPMTIDIFDGDKNRIKRWANVTDNSGVIVGKMEMSQYPVLGTWAIKVKRESVSKTQEFKVQEYELPKFDVTINMPEVVTLLDSTLEGKVSSKYTFGKGVTGSLQFILSYYSKKMSKIYQLNDGQVNIEIPTSDIYEAIGFKPSHYYSTYTVRATAIVTEDITGNTREDSVDIKFMKFDASIKIESSTTFYTGQSFLVKGRVTSRSGSSYQGQAAEMFLVKLTVHHQTRGSYDYKAWISDKVLQIDSRNHFNFTVNGSLITDEIFRIRTKVQLIWVKTQESLRYLYSYAYPPRTVNGSLLNVKQVSGSNPLNVGDTARYKISMTGPGTLKATYKVISNGVIVKNGNWFSISENSPYFVEIKASESMRPMFAVVCWFILPNDRISSSNSYDHVAANGVTTSITDKTVDEETSIAFQKKTQQPGENARLNLKSSPRSSFYVLAVDKSVLLLDKGNDITEAMLPDLYDGSLTDINFGNSRTVTDVFIRAKLQIRTFSVYLTSSSSSVFSSSSANAIRSSSQSRPQIGANRVAASMSRRFGTPPPKLETKRTKFPETWMFLNATADSKGEASIVKHVPDTITTWVASCFAVGTESRISIAGKNSELEIFLPFFISLQLPNYVIKTEQVVLQANIFNYHTEDLYVLVTLKKSSQFRGLAVVKRGKQRVLEEKCGDVILCIFAKAGRGTAAFFPIIPTSTGNIKITITADSSLFKDTVIKTLRVESEGAPRSVAYPIFIDLTEKTTFDTHLDLNYPPNTVEGSQRMRVSLIGDIMGPTLDGLERLVKMPYGCGEQNMVSTAPSVFVYRYFSSVDRLSNEIRQKAENFMRIGMQRQLTYKHPDWSFSAWGGKSGSGSTWLTAFVLKVFSIASNYVEIDSLLITKSALFLTNIQNPDGSFPEKGRVDNRWLQGGASGTIERMTAFVLIALLKARKASPNLEFCDSCMRNLNKSIDRSSNFVANNLDNQTSVYTVAISSYALTLAEHKGAWRARNKLDGLSKDGPASNYVEIDSLLITKSALFLTNIQNPDGSFPEKGRVDNRWLQGGASGTIERMTAFVLIALLEARKASPNLEFCDSCMRNLNKSIDRSSNFVANNLDNQTSVYTVAISSYALTLAEHKGAWRARNKLDGLSKDGPGYKYWEMPDQPPPSRFHYGPSTKAVSIEMTAYGLLAYVDTESLLKSLPILNWLTRQRNPYGGFISTQDTVIALEALSKMAAKIYSKKLNMDLILSYTDSQLRKKKFQIDANNAMVMQLADISTDTKSISMHAWGTKGSTAILTVSLFYNIFMDLEDRSLRLEVTVIKETINGFTLKSCVSWLENETSGMVVVEIGTPSGFEANRWGISEHKLLKRTEIDDRNVILYYDEVPYKIEICTEISFLRDKMVAKTKPVPCKAYEYYEPSNQVTVFYAPLSAKNANICDICGIECGCQTTKQKIWFPQSWCKKRV